MERRTVEHATLIQALWPASGPNVLLRGALSVLAGAILLTASAKLKVPFYPVPMTMQTFVVLVLGAAYGARLGTGTVLTYLALGAVGLPVFADTPERGLGFAYMVGPTGGFLVGFAAAAFAVGALAERGWDRSIAWLFLAMAVGHVVLFAFGVTWLAALIGWTKAWALGVAPFYLATVLKTALAAATIAGLGSVAAKLRSPML